MNGYWPAYFLQRKLTWDENIIENSSWKKVVFGTRYFKEVDEFLLTNFMMKKNMKDHFLEDKEEIKKVFRDMMEGQFEHDLYNKTFSNQLESDETDTVQQRIKWWTVIVGRGGPIPNDVYDYSFAELFNLYQKAIDPAMQDLAKLLSVREIIT